MIEKIANHTPFLIGNWFTIINCVIGDLIEQNSRQSNHQSNHLPFWGNWLRLWFEYVNQIIKSSKNMKRYPIITCRLLRSPVSLGFWMIWLVIGGLQSPIKSLKLSLTWFDWWLDLIAIVVKNWWFDCDLIGRCSDLIGGQFWWFDWWLFPTMLIWLGHSGWNLQGR